MQGIVWKTTGRRMDGWTWARLVGTSLGSWHNICIHNCISVSISISMPIQHSIRPLYKYIYILVTSFFPLLCCRMARVCSLAHLAVGTGKVSARFSHMYRVPLFYFYSKSTNVCYLFIPLLYVFFELPLLQLSSISCHLREESKNVLFSHIAKLDR